MAYERRSPSTTVARKLRREMTPEEVMLWQNLRGKRMGVSFRRQEPMGRYVADFVCYERKLVIELDGSQHLHRAEDRERDADMLEHGFLTLRFWNNDVRTNLSGVLERIQTTLESRKGL
ncbi:endonuclease domain-containing protein [Deinococcus antarcticus]|mgnify:CR=1 FL=1|uniref:Endonuclease domain-containing protein n=1 Tax=Deinococcus antarcticus TaxID=1298767 RepID=A0ABV8AC42_9DEIO